MYRHPPLKLKWYRVPGTACLAMLLGRVAAATTTTAAQQEPAVVDEAPLDEAPLNEAPLDEAPLDERSPVEPPIEMPSVEVTVRGTPRERSQAGSDYTVKIGQLAAVPRRSAEQLLTLAPGLLLTNHGGQFHAASFFLRGFDAGEGQDLEISVEGVPLNEVSNPHVHGYADTHFLISRLVSEVRVIEGPFDPRQGDFAVAGSARYTLGLEERGLHLTVGQGSWDRRQLTLLWGPDGAGPGTFAGVELEDGNGFGRNRAFAAARAMARQAVVLNTGTRLAVLATSYANRFDSAGVIRRDDYFARRLPCASSRDAQFFCTYDPNQGGAGSRHALSFTLDHENNGSAGTLSAFIVLRELRLRQNFTGYVTDTNSMGFPQRGDGTEQSYGALTFGTRGSYRVSRRQAPEEYGWHRELEVGYLVRHDLADSRVRRLRTLDGVPYRVDANDGLGVTNIGGYFAGRLTLKHSLTLSGGVRVDALSFSVEDRNRSTSDRTGSRLPSETTEAYGLAVQPKMGADLTVADPLHWVLALGIGTRSSYAQALSAGEFAPFARVVATETGFIYKRGWASATIDARLLAYHTHLTRDLLFDEGAGRNVLVGASNRFGALTSMRCVLPPRWDLLASLTYAEAYLPPAGQEGLAFARGARLPYVPRWVARFDGAWQEPFRVRDQTLTTSAAAGLTYVGPRPLPFEQSAPAFATLDLATRVELSGWRLGLEITNLLDRRNRESVFNYASNFRGPAEPASLLPQQHFSAGAPRALFVTLSASVAP